MFETSPLPVRYSKSADEPPSPSPRHPLKIALSTLVLTVCLTVTLFAIGVFLTGCEGDAKPQAEDASTPSPAKQAVLNYSYDCGGSTIRIRPVDTATGKFATALPPVTSASGSAGACAIDPHGKFLFLPATVIGVGSSSVASYTIDGGTGGLTPTTPATIDITAAGDKTFPEPVIVDPAGKFVFVGNTATGFESVSVFAINATTGVLTEAPGSPNALPQAVRVLAVHPSGKFLYAGIGAASPSSNVFAFTINSSGALFASGTPVSVSSFATGLAIDPAGKRLFVAGFNNNVEVFDIDSTDGSLSGGTPTVLSSRPSGLAIDPSGKYLYVGLPLVATNNLVGFTINDTTGALTPIPGSPYTAVGSDGAGGTVATDIQSVSIEPTGRFLYASSNTGVNGTDGFLIDPPTGQLAHIGGAGGFPVRGGNTAAVILTTKLQ